MKKKNTEAVPDSCCDGNSERQTPCWHQNLMGAQNLLSSQRLTLISSNQTSCSYILSSFIYTANCIYVIISFIY